MAQILERRVKGDLNLDELESFCEIVQNISVCKLVRISKKTDEPEGKFNLTLFDKVPFTEQVLKPVLIRVNHGDDASDIIAEQMTAGKKFLFDATIFLQGGDARVLGFR